MLSSDFQFRFFSRIHFRSFIHLSRVSQITFKIFDHQKSICTIFFTYVKKSRQIGRSYALLSYNVKKLSRVFSSVKSCFCFCLISKFDSLTFEVFAFLLFSQFLVLTEISTVEKTIENEKRGVSNRKCPVIYGFCFDSAIFQNRLLKNWWASATNQRDQTQ